MSARYDGHADWYDERFRQLSAAQGSAGVLASLLGPPDPDDPTLLDIGCGTGLHHGVVRARGYDIIGLDLSADQLRVASLRTRRLVRADGRRLPLRDASVSAVTMTFTHTDVDDFPRTIAEAARVLRPGGRLVYLGPHPSYVGSFVSRSDEIEQRQLVFTSGYGDERLQRSDDEHFAIRHRVGARYLTLTTFLNAFLDQPSLRLSSVGEYDTAMRPWRPGGDDRVLPWNIAVTASSGSPPRFVR